MDFKNVLPITVNELEAKRGDWPPALFTGLTEAMLLMMVTAKDEPSTKVVLEMCPHQVLGTCRNLLIVLADRMEFTPDQTVTLQMLASICHRMSDEIPSCKDDPIKPLPIGPEDMGRAN